MTIACPHWSECGVNGGGCCALGLYGGMPSLGTCAYCLALPDYPPPLAETVPALADDATYQARLALCQSCGTDGGPGVSDDGRCQAPLCGCLVANVCRDANRACAATPPRWLPAIPAPPTPAEVQHAT